MADTKFEAKEISLEGFQATIRKQQAAYDQAEVRDGFARPPVGTHNCILESTSFRLVTFKGEQFASLQVSYLIDDGEHAGTHFQESYNFSEKGMPFAKKLAKVLNDGVPPAKVSDIPGLVQQAASNKAKLRLRAFKSKDGQYTNTDIEQLISPGTAPVGEEVEDGDVET